MKRDLSCEGFGIDRMSAAVFFLCPLTAAADDRSVTKPNERDCGCEKEEVVCERR